MKSSRVVPKVSYYVETSMALMSGRRRKRSLSKSLHIIFVCRWLLNVSYMVTTKKPTKCAKGQKMGETFLKCESLLGKRVFVVLARCN